MSKNITWLGNSYSNVGYVDLPQTGGGTAYFHDVTDTTAEAADVTSGKYFYDASGVRTAGTNSGGGLGNVQFDTETVTASNYPTSLSFTGLKGEPKAFVVRLNASVSSSGNSTYYYIVDIAHFGTNTHGNCFRVGGTRQVTSITSGYSYSYSNGTLTLTSSASSRSASPGAFYSGSYELLYAY